MDNSGMAYFERPDADALDETIGEWRKDAPEAGAFALVAEAHAAAVPALQGRFGAMGLPLAGAVAPELIWDGRFRQGGVLLSRCRRMPAHRIVDCPADPRKASEAVGAALAEFAAAARPGRDTLFLVFDAMVPNVASILDDLYLRLADRVNYAGVCAGSESFRPLPCLFDGERLAGGAVLALLLPERGGAVLEHGYRAPEEMIAATSSRGNRIESIDWRPAFAVYQEQAKTLFGAEVSRDNFYRHAVRLPFGILRAEGDVLVRIPVALEPDGAILCVGEIPENAVLTLLQAEEREALDSVDQLARGLAGHAGPVLTFYCAGRRLHKGEQAVAEIRALGERLGVAAAGALSLGEIGNSHRGGYPLFHNAALACVPWIAP